MAVQELGNPSLNQGTISAIGDFGPLVVPSGHGRAWLAEDRGGLLVTTDGGVTWSPVFNDTSEADTFGPPFVSFFGTTQGWAATGYGLWHTTDGVDWSDIVPAPASSG